MKVLKNEIQAKERSLSAETSFDLIENTVMEIKVFRKMITHFPL